MTSYLRAAMIAAAVSIAVKLLGFFTFRHVEHWDMGVRLTYLLVFLAAMVIESVMQARSGATFKTVVSHGMKVTSIYALLITAFTWIYYRWVESDYFSNHVQRIVDAALKSDPAHVEQVRQNAEFVFSPFTHATLTLIGVMVLGFFYSLVTALIVEKVKQRL